MRIYVSVDMEGLAGVAHPNQVVFGIGGVDRTGTIARTYSNFGEVIALMAPGGNYGHAQGVLSTVALPRDGFSYAHMTGTSQASAVSWQSSALRAPPPTMWTTATSRPASRVASRTVRP